MNFELSSEHKFIRWAVQKFAEKKVESNAALADQSHTFSWEILQAMFDLDIVGVSFPEEYGGTGSDELSRILIIEELAKCCPSTALTLSVTQIAPHCILTFGTEEQKQKYMPGLLSGGKLSAFALTEPNSGSDAYAMQSTAQEDGNYFVINGSKSFITHGALASLIVVFAATSKNPKRISAFIVEKGMPGLSYDKPEEKMGMRGTETTGLFFDNLRVPKENLLGELGKGFNIAMAALDSGRIGIGAQSLGIAERALREAINYSRGRIQFGKPIAMQQGLSWYTAEMKTRIEAARNLVYKAAWLKSKKEPHTLDAAIAKFYASEIANFCVKLSLQIHGGNGYMKEYPIERFYRDAKVLEIYEGTSEINKLVIARETIGRF